MSIEPGSPDISPEDIARMELEVTDTVRQEQQRGANLEGYPEVPALVEQDEPTAEELEERAKASIQPLPAPEESSADQEPDWPPHIERQVEQGNLTPGQADWATRKKTSASSKNKEQPPLDKAA